MGDCRTVDMHQASQKLEPLKHSAAVSVDTTTRFPTMSTMDFDERKAEDDAFNRRAAISRVRLSLARTRLGAIPRLRR